MAKEMVLDLLANQGDLLDTFFHLFFFEYLEVRRQGKPIFQRKKNEI